MLNTVQRRRQPAQRGQVLILALAFIGFFGLVAVAVLDLAGVSGLQHVNTESVANSDSLDEGGAALAESDAQRGNGADLAQLDCVASGTSSSVTMAKGGGTVSYATTSCNPGQSTIGGGPVGNPCVLCILNEASASPSPSTVVLTTKKTIDVVGDVDVNGSISGGLVSQPIACPSGDNTCVACPAPNNTGTYAFCPHINVWDYGLSGDSTCSNCTPIPTEYSAPIRDPLAGTMSIMPPNGLGLPLRRQPVAQLKDRSPQVFTPALAATAPSHSAKAVAAVSTCSRAP